MRTECICLLGLAAPALAGLIPTPGEVFQEVDTLLHRSDSDKLVIQADFVDPVTRRQRQKCTLSSLGQGGDDTDNFLLTVDKCGKGGIISLPDDVYTITRPLEIELEDAVVDAYGFITHSGPVQYWIDNRIEFEFQNQSLALVISGKDFVLDGHNTGGIDGGGQAWYDYAKDYGNKFGRPMTLAIANATNVVLQNWTVKQPQFWASILIRSKDVIVRDFYVNATSYNPESWSDNKSWLQNTDGIDTYISDNVTIENFVYQGGDDCIALKPNSTNIYIRNATCYGGTGIALGSIAQYDGVLDIIENVLMEDLALYPSSQCLGYQGLYAKSWIGESHGLPPNGGGGGYGYGRNITFRNVYMEDIIHPIVVDTTLTYLPDVKGRPDVKGSVFEWYDIHFENITGTATGNRIVWMDCPKHLPCHDFTFSNIDITPGKDDHPEIGYVCNNFVLDGSDGLDQCHPSNSTLEMGSDGTL